jgi:prolyl oligopeptidase
MNHDSTIRRVLALILLTLFAPLALGQDYLPECPPDRDPGLWDLMNRAIDIMYESDPMGIAPLLNDESRNDELGNNSAQSIERDTQRFASLLGELRSIDRSGFTDRDHLSADLLIYQWEQGQRLAAYKQWQMPVTSIGGPQVWLPQIADQVPLRTRDHYADYLTRLKRVPIAIGDTIDNMRLGIADNRVPPRVVVEPAVEQSLAQSNPDFREDPTQSPFYAPFLNLDHDDPLAIEARQVIAKRIVPVYLELAVFLSNEYLPACRDTIGAAQGIDGIDSYSALITSHTTLPQYDANAVHQIGLDEVQRIKSEMMDVIAQTDWIGNDKPWASADAKFQSFTEYLRTDPRFYFTNPDDLLNAYLIISKIIDPELPKLFGTLPRNTYGVRPLPGLSAESAPTAYYYPGSLTTGQAGYFVANLTKLDQRPSYDMLALTLHEAVPGHHLQIALAQEIENQHPIRKTMGFTGFVEGWALYAEKLGLEMGEHEHGLYDDPYSNFGRLNFEMWRAMRLVVDTGMHAKNWTRDHGVEFMRANSALSLHNINAEIDRYIGWPGQATGYKMGEIEIIKLRRALEEELGDDFDLRAFHDELLADGALPIPVLVQKMNRWADTQRRD